MPFFNFDVVFYAIYEVDLTREKVEAYGLYLQSPKTFVQSPHNFAKTNLTLFSYFYNPLVLLSVDDFDVPSFHLSIDELIFEVDLHFEVICDVVSTHDFLPVDNVVTNWFFEIDKELENVKKTTKGQVNMSKCWQAMCLMNGGTFKALEYKTLLWICLKM